MRPSFHLRDCDANRELALAVVRYVNDLKPCASGFGVDIEMSYDKSGGGDLAIECVGGGVVASCAIMVSIMSAAMIMGARQDSEWADVMGKAWSVMSGHIDESAPIISDMARRQLEIANRIRVSEAQERRCA